MVGWCSGCISGLVAATPASGFIPPWGAIILGIVTGIISNFATKIKFWIRIDDSLDILAEHGIAGMVGLVFNGLFGASYIIGLDGVNTGLINGGWLNHNYKQLYIQVAYIVACTAYSFTVSAILAFVINTIPGLHLRATEEAELLGMDDDQLGEFAYDYVEVRRDYLAWTPATDEPRNGDECHVPVGQRHGIQEHSDMIEGKSSVGQEKVSDEGSASASAGSAKRQRLVAMGDRHGMKVEEMEKEKLGLRKDE